MTQVTLQLSMRSDADGPVRVAYCIDNMQIGGTEMNAFRTAVRLDRSRFDLSVLCLKPDGPLLARYAAAGIPVLAFPVSSLYGVSAVRQGIRLARFIEREHIQIVHSHDRYSNIFATPWARVARTPVVIASKRWGSARRVHRIGNRLAYRLAHRVLANSPIVATSLWKADGVSRDRIVVIPNFVDESAFLSLTEGERRQMLRELDVPAGVPLIGVVASLRPIKGHATLLRAVASLHRKWPNLRVILVGEGESRPELEDLALSLGIGQYVRFVGLRPHEPNLNQLFDISVLPSLSEGFPNAVLEAMAAGRPVVATNVGGTPDAVHNGETGLLVPPEQPEAMAAALALLLSDPELRCRMGAAGRRAATERYSAGAIIPALESLYRNLVTT